MLPLCEKHVKVKCLCKKWFTWSLKSKFTPRFVELFCLRCLISLHLYIGVKNVNDLAPDNDFAKKTLIEQQRSVKLIYLKLTGSLEYSLDIRVCEESSAGVGILQETVHRSAVQTFHFHTFLMTLLETAAKHCPVETGHNL